VRPPLGPDALQPKVAFDWSTILEMHLSVRKTAVSRPWQRRDAAQKHEAADPHLQSKHAIHSKGRRGGLKGEAA